MDKKIQRIGTVLAALPEDQRVELARTLLPPGLVIVTNRCNADIEAAFNTAGQRIHAGLKQEMKFSPNGDWPMLESNG